MTRKALVAFAALAWLTAFSAQAQSAKEVVTFSSLDKSNPVVLKASFLRPSGPGPFPAMVLLHTCGGLAPYIDAWATWFASQGYAALVVDSFGPRGLRNVCGGGTPTMRTRVFDASGALAFLRSRPEIDGARVGVIGWSHGAGTAYLADNAAIAGSSAPNGGGFAAAIALYPPCRSAPPAISAPLLFLLGQDDDWTPAADCQADADLLKQGKVPVIVQVYPGATHAFDNPAGRGSVHVGPHVYTLDYNASAARDAHDRVAAFLATQMKK